MEHHERQRTQTMQVLQESERLIAEVDAVLERNKRLLESRGLDREEVRRQVETMSPAAREQVRLQVDKLMKEAEERGNEAMLHAQFNPSIAPRSRRLHNRV